MISKNNLRHVSIVLVLLLISLFVVACSSSGGTEPAADDETMEEMDDMEHDDDMEDMEHEHEESDGEAARIPNEGGATITITSPKDGETFGTLDQVIVEVEVENFELSGESHWHVYVDDVSFGMVMGGNMDQALAGLSPGEHKISTYLSINTHEEYEDGDSVTIVIEE